MNSNAGIALIRKLFLEFFRERGHKILPSSPLVPEGDQSLLFTNAGMVQFKDIFLGKTTAKYDRVATCQKCVRAGGKHNDLENVGYTARHHTFFEMLGNFSFGGYFKEEAIALAWEFLTEVLLVDRGRLYVTVSDRDDSAANIWKIVAGLEDSRIITVTGEDNFWSMGDVGPCGPCTEIFYDYGPQYKGVLSKDIYDPDERFIEIWNLVFMESNKHADGTISPLPVKCIDTGMGLERIAAVCQGVYDNYNTDLFRQIIDNINSNNTGMTKPSDDPDIADKNEVVAVTQIAASISLRVIADHMRAATFLIADCVLPSNVGRGYILRKIIRRAIRYAKKINDHELQASRTVPIVVALMEEQYPEISRPEILSIIEAEEGQFTDTLSAGIQFLSKNIVEGRISDDLTFRLYDTYGLPFDMSKEILREYGIEANEEQFSRHMAEQKARGRDSWKTSDSYSLPLHGARATQFIGYGIYSSVSKITHIFVNNKAVDKILPNESGAIVLDTTPFYALSGGQIGDIGQLKIDGQIVANIYDCIKENAVYVHKCTSLQELHVGDKITAIIDIERRKDIARNHSATHLLHFALRKVLGRHVMQKGSLVANDKLRFDFSHTGIISGAEIAAIENCVNRFINDANDVKIEEMSIERAQEKGAMALFGEKYGNIVRVISMHSEDNLSMELCGGSHVKNTSDIRLFKIISVESIGSGIRRIEAVSGRHALDMLNAQSDALRVIYKSLKVSGAEEALGAVGKLQHSLQHADKRIERLSGIIQTIPVLGEQSTSDVQVDSKYSTDTVGDITLIIISMGNPRFASNYINKIAGDKTVVIGIEVKSPQFGKIYICAPTPQMAIEILRNSSDIKGRVTQSGPTAEAGINIAQDIDLLKEIREKAIVYLTRTL